MKEAIGRLCTPTSYCFAVSATGTFPSPLDPFEFEGSPITSGERIVSELQWYYGDLSGGLGGHAVRGFVKQFGVAFEPKSVKILTDAFDDAWARLQVSNAPYGTEDFALAGRTKLAKHIINAARYGEWKIQDGWRTTRLCICHDRN